MKKRLYLILIFVTVLLLPGQGQQIKTSLESADGDPEINVVMAEKGQTITDLMATVQSRYLQVEVDPGYLPEGDYAHKPAFSGDGTRVLLANAITDNVTVFDANTMEALANVDVGYFPVDVVCTEDYAIVPCVFDNQAYVIDLNDYSIAGVFDTGEQPAVVKVSHDGTRAFVGCDVDDVVEVIDLENMTHLATIENFPVALRSASWISGSGRFYYTWFQFLVSPDDAYLVTSNYDGQVDVYDIQTGEIAQSMLGLDNITELNFSGDGNRLIAVTYANPAILHQIDFNTFTVETNVTLDGLGIWGNGVAVNSDGSKAFLGVNGNQTALVRFETGDYTFYPTTQTAFWCDNSFDHQYAVSGQFRFTIFDFENELITGFYWGIAQYLGAVSPTEYKAVGIDPGRYEGLAFYDFNDPSNVDYMGRMPSGEIPEGDVPYAVAIAPDGSKAVVVNNLSENVSVIDLETHEVEDIVDIGESGYTAAITHDSKWAVVGGYDLNTVKIIDLETNELVTTVGTGQRPGMISIAPDDSYAYVGNIKSNNVSFVKLDGANSVNEKTIPVGVIGLSWAAYGVRSAVEVSPTGEYLLVAASFDDYVKVIDTELQEIVATVPTGDFPLQIAFNAEGTHAVVTNYTGNTFSVIEVDGANSSLVGTFPASNTGPIRLKYNPVKDEVSIVHLSDNKTILNVEPETGNVISSYSFPTYGSPLQIHFDADGLPLLITSPTDNRNAALLYNDEVYELPSSPIHFDYSAEAQLVVIAEGGGGPDNVTIVDWLNTGTGELPAIQQAQYKPCYISSVSPNPASGPVTVKYWISPNYKGKALMTISDESGRTIRSMNLTGKGIAEISPDLSGLESGIYFIGIRCGDHRSVKKVVIR